MANSELTNKEYLEILMTDAEDAPAYVLLPHETAKVQEAKAENDEAIRKIIEEKKAVTGGDDYHDGAFRATDKEIMVQNDIKASLAPYLDPTLVARVGYPEEKETRATLGSRVNLRQGRIGFPVDIVGFRRGYPQLVIDPETKDAIDAISPESPLSRAILGKTQGESGTYKMGEKSITVTIERINQTAIAEYFMTAAGVETNEGDA